MEVYKVTEYIGVDIGDGDKRTLHGYWLNQADAKKFCVMQPDRYKRKDRKWELHADGSLAYGDFSITPISVQDTFDDTAYSQFVNEAAAAILANIPAEDLAALRRAGILLPLPDSEESGDKNIDPNVGSDEGANSH